jgi:hypothetical protein
VIPDLKIGSPFDYWFRRRFCKVVVVAGRILKWRTWVVLQLLLSEFD